MTEKERQDIILKQMCEVCDRLYEIWNDATKLDSYDLRSLVMRESSSTFYAVALLCREIDGLINKEEGGVFHA